MNLDCFLLLRGILSIEILLRVLIVPVGGGFETLSGSSAGGFLQWMEVFGLLWSV